MLTRQFDSLFAAHAGVVPVAYLRALAQRESGLNPRAANPGGADAAKGILQVVGVLRNDYNRVNGTNYTPDDMFDPNINVKIAAWLINRIVKAYGKHPSPNLKMNWSNPEFVKLVTQGWNAGYSEGGGVGKVATALERAGQQVTHDSVAAAADDVGAAKWLALPKRSEWHRTVSDLFDQQPDKLSTGGGAKLLLVLAAAGAAFWYFRGRA